MKEQFMVYTAKNGERFVQTRNKYLAHSLAYLGFRFMVFKENDTNVEFYSFKYSDELLDTLEHIEKLKKDALY